ncbi:ArsS family sensor histidine kinase [Aliarcobacter butzleri]|uniref:ArsS family sensor histidine kinase n=1 Tax=Aliarcobacter butzleri TaxID=28197 RepID=UPI00125FC28F|nr:ArsS family sensor histidine kinase [Aliarcobacter butzleri]MCG3686054.1 ArsS family sensor histidine kinase [Aliarcobacter butzleri]
MINRQSIFFTILISFLISILLVIISFIIILANSYKAQEEQIYDRYIPISKMINRIEFDFSEEIIKNFEEMNYKLYIEKKEINKITNDKNMKIFSERIHPKHGDIFRILKNNTDYYLYMKVRDNEVLVKDQNGFSNSRQIYIILVFSILLITITILYFMSLKKLMPLKVLKDKVKSLGDENFDFEYENIEAKDEVSSLAMEFKKTSLKLKNLKEARNVFIRNIMHELKTPITKGKFLTQLEQNEENNEKLKSVFDRLESLINEFATIEELISSTKNIEKKVYFLDDIIDNAKDILMIEDEKVIQNYENKKIEVNFKLFSIAIKNLIDNAVKYSPNKEVTIKVENENIIFENIGKELEAPFEKYFEPFFSSEDKSKNSFGLGLYIVYNIFKANGYILEYEHINGLNRFICKKG